MWQCPKCHEEIESEFEVCWNCGTTVDGIEDPNFQKEEPPPLEREEPPLLESELVNRFLCPKCQSHGASVKRIATTGAGLSRLLDLQHNIFIAASCSNCGYTEFYNPEVWEGKTIGINLLDVIFGK